MRVLDLFSGLGGWSAPFAKAGHDVFRVELNPDFDAELHADILEVGVGDFPWRPDLVLASPPCTWFSVLNIGKNWTVDGAAKTDEAVHAVRLVEATLDLIDGLSPRWWIVENPRAKLRKLEVVEWLPRETVTYCQYGEGRMKPTDLWGGFPSGWRPRPACRNGDPCHVAAPRGSRSGTQGMTSAESAVVPYELGDSVRIAVEAAEPYERSPLPGFLQPLPGFVDPNLQPIGQRPRDSWTTLRRS